MRKVFCEDAIKWLNEYSIDDKSSMVASMPDYSEFPELKIHEWKEWFINTAKLIIEKTHEDQVSVFYQSDIKHNGVWVDKSYLIMKAAESAGVELLWHKMICRVPAGMVTFGRPSYSHIICFSKKLKIDVQKSTADIIPTMGEKIWERGMAPEACVLISKFIKNETTSNTIINPFCGMGSMLAVANSFDLNAIGIERGTKRARTAEKIQFNNQLNKWI